MNNKARNNKARNNKSLCEKSMEMVTNIIKLSSLSIAKITLGTAEPAVSTKRFASVTGSIVADSKPLLPQYPGSRRSQEPESDSKPLTYLIEPIEGNRSSYVIREEKSVDGKAAEYIRRVHTKNRSDSYGTTMFSPYILPPPPPPPPPPKMN